MCDGHPCPFVSRLPAAAVCPRLCGFHWHLLEGGPPREDQPFSRLHQPADRVRRLVVCDARTHDYRTLSYVRFVSSTVICVREAKNGTADVARSRDGDSSAINIGTFVLKTGVNSGENLNVCSTCHF